MATWNDMPSLTALRAFEAASRQLNFSAAGRELNVTHAAVAQQVRGLEAELGVELIYRQGRGLALTAEGSRLAQALGESFAGLAQAVRDVTARRADAPLRVTLTPVFAAQWLMPRLGGFWLAHADIEISLHPGKRPVDLRREGIELAIRFGQGHWPGLEAEYFTSSHFAIVGAPSLLDGRQTLSQAELAAMPWLAVGDRAEAQTWMGNFGLDPASLAITHVPTEELAMSAARQGYGLYAETEALVQQDVREGRLVILGRMRDPRLAYYLVTQPGPKRAALRLFMAWLKSVT